MQGLLAAPPSCPCDGSARASWGTPHTGPPAYNGNVLAKYISGLQQYCGFMLSEKRVAFLSGDATSAFHAQYMT